MIPARLVRSVPEHTDDATEALWHTARVLHPGWKFETFRDPINPERFPITADLWPRCTSGAQLAGLVRLETLWHDGGIWIDSDFECWRPFTPLLVCEAFAGWEDRKVVPDAVLGARPEHPAIGECLNLAAERMKSESIDWRTGRGAWSTGPGVTTAVLPGRDDVVLFPPGSFFPVHYSEKLNVGQRATRNEQPWAFGEHRWAGSWLGGG